MKWRGRDPTSYPNWLMRQSLNPDVISQCGRQILDVSHLHFSGSCMTTSRNTGAQLIKGYIEHTQTIEQYSDATENHQEVIPQAVCSDEIIYFGLFTSLEYANQSLADVGHKLLVVGPRRYTLLPKKLKSHHLISYVWTCMNNVVG
jgi:hypothetical protein